MSMETTFMMSGLRVKLTFADVRNRLAASVNEWFPLLLESYENTRRAVS